jgi:hypothetical protein
MRPNRHDRRRAAALARRGQRGDAKAGEGNVTITLFQDADGDLICLRALKTFGNFRPSRRNFAEIT